MAFVLSILFFSKSVLAEGKLDTVKEIVLEKCPKIEINDGIVLELSRKLYLSCMPGSIIRFDEECKIPCLKKLKGTIIGDDL